MSLKKIVVLVSGSGTNLQSLIDNIHNKFGEIALVISDTPDVYSLTRAKNAGIRSEVIDYKSFSDKNYFYETLFKKVTEQTFDLIVLAGFLKILPGKFYETFENKIINIHPALIPSFCGKGYYGLKVHEAAIAYGVKVSGATVHFADGQADTGAIILQKAVEVCSDDTPEELQKKVLVLEHELLPKAVRLFLQDKLEVAGRKVRILD